MNCGAMRKKFDSKQCVIRHQSEKKKMPRKKNGARHQTQVKSKQSNKQANNCKAYGKSG